MLEPLLKDLKSFEDDSIFVPSLGKAVKGTILAVVADNLGAHSIAGFVKSFSSSHFCRFCIGETSQIQEHEVGEGLFPLRTKSSHAMHVEAALSDLVHIHHLGVKRQCPISDILSHFDATSGYPLMLCMICLRGLYHFRYHSVLMCLSRRSTSLFRSSTTTSVVFLISGVTE